MPEDPGRSTIIWMSRSSRFITTRALVKLSVALMPPSHVLATNPVMVASAARRRLRMTMDTRSSTKVNPDERRR